MQIKINQHSYIPYQILKNIYIKKKFCSIVYFTLYLHPQDYNVTDQFFSQRFLLIKKVIILTIFVI